MVPYTQQPRRVRVLLPVNYEENTTKTYPVVYMHDGQNVIHSRESYSGYSWKVIPHLKFNPNLPELIIVAIDNDGENRLDEYTPWPFPHLESTASRHLGGLGKKYGKWVVEEVKPFIDAHYRTKQAADQTFLAGSSLGGLITAYMGAAYPDVFGVLGVFSLASWVQEEAFLHYIQHQKINPTTKVYIQVGTKEGNETDESFMAGNMDQKYIDSSLWYYQTLLKTGAAQEQLWLRILAYETHYEKYWADHFGEFLEFGFSQ